MIEDFSKEKKKKKMKETRTYMFHFVCIVCVCMLFEVLHSFVKKLSCICMYTYAWKELEKKIQT